MGRCCLLKEMQWTRLLTSGPRDVKRASVRFILREQGLTWPEVTKHPAYIEARLSYVREAVNVPGYEWLIVELQALEAATLPVKGDAKP